MKVELRLKRTSWCYLTMDVTDEEYDMLSEGDLSPIWDNETVCEEYVREMFDWPCDIKEEVEEMEVIE